MIEVKHLSAGYSGELILKDLSLTVPEGAVTVLAGPNGCGKTTLLKALCGILPVQGGQILLNGEDILMLPRRQLAQKVAYLSQSRQTSDITVGRLVLHGRFPYLSYPRRYRKTDYAWAESAMEQMGIADLADTPLQNLSGGQRQKAYIAMALAQDTPVVLLDEPTTYLDIQHQLQLMKHARNMAAEGKTVLMILHDLPHAFQCADRLILMQAGKVVAQDAPERVYASGEVERVFGIRMGRTMTDGGWRYYCEEGEV